MPLLKHSLLSTALVLCSAGANALSVTPEDSGETLANTILGTGISIDATSINYIGGSGQAGIFTDGMSSGIGLSSGILLTTGSASIAEGPNNSSGAGTTTSTGSDPDLQSLVGGTINDRNVLEFDFESDGGDLFFSYVFASEEYNEFVNSNFNDVFAFLVDGTNIATIGDDFVAIDTINCGSDGASTGVNCNRFNDNTDGAFDLQYDGFTDVLVASITGLSVGTHTMKLAIGDRGDSILDSAVFIQAGSFSNEPDPDPDPDPDPVGVPEPGTLALLGLGLIGLMLSRRRT